MQDKEEALHLFDLLTDRQKLLFVEVIQSQKMDGNIYMNIREPIPVYIEDDSQRGS